jgi:hypothetical protein
MRKKIPSTTNVNPPRGYKEVKKERRVKVRRKKERRRRKAAGTKGKLYPLLNFNGVEAYTRWNYLWVSCL